MIKRRRFPKIFFGWGAVLTGGILSMWGMGYYGYGFSALFKPISEELGFSRAVASVPASIGRFEGGIEAPLSGWLTDKYGPKWVVLFGVFVVGLGLILMSFINSLWTFYAVWGVMVGTGINIGFMMPFVVAITNWFVKKRGRALGVQWVIAGLSGVVVLPLIAWLIETYGWRQTCLIGGVVMWLVGFPLTWFCLKQHRPEYYGLLPDGATVGEGEASQTIEKGVEYAAGVGEVEFTVKQALKTSGFWLLVAASSAQGLAGGAMNIHCIPFLTDIGIDPIKAASMMSLYVFVSLPLRLIGGLIGDRVSKNRLRFLMAGAYLLQGMGFAVYLLHQTIPMIYVWFVIYGLGMGLNFPLLPMVTGSYFGRKAYGSIRGILTMVIAPVGIMAPIYAGWIYDTTDSYITVFILFSILVTISAILVSFARPPKPPTQTTDVSAN